MRLRLFELFLLFAVLPMILFGLKASGIRVAPLPILWLAMICCLVLLWRSGKSSPPKARDRENVTTRSRALIEVVITVVVGSLLLVLL